MVRHLLCAAIAVVLAAAARADEPKLKLLIELNKLKIDLEREHDLSQAKAAEIKDPAARRQFWSEFTARHAPAYQQALRIAQQNLADKTAVDALLWTVVGPLSYTKETGPTIDQAIQLLTEHHIKDQRIALLCQAISRFEVQSAFALPLIATALEKSPLKATRGVACVRLGDVYAEQARVGELLQSQATTVEKEQWKTSLTPERLKFFTELNVAEFRKQAEKAWEKAAQEYPDVKLIGDVTVGDTSRGRLFKRRDLVPGKPLPELTGHTLDGQPLNLRDYRGKVVVLTFWADWCPPSVAAATKQRALLERHAGKPFALIGVAGDYDLETAQNAVERAKIPWVSLFDGNAGRGKIATKWGVSSWPTFFVIDHKGTIRHVLDSDDTLETIVDQLMAEIK